ncbi:MAG: T9SS type A sorting domain-containing protein, partial [Flavobacteriales bacterium]|nr:T9SS type A sorting domain-containing protein [Flavobacteriales bacterium]
HYIQAHLDRLTFQKNLVAFSDSEIELWITEFNAYDYSEKCDAAFSSWQDEDFVYDSADWLHALNIFTIMDRFLTYRSEMDDPWTNNAFGMDISKIAMHLFYGAEREAAMTEDRLLTGAGLAMKEIIHLMNDADSIQRLLIAPEELIDIDPLGNWTPDLPVGDMLPLHNVLEYADHTGAVTTMNTLDAHGWLYKNGEDDKALIVNLRDEPLTLDLDGMASFQGDTRYSIHYVAPEHLTTHIDQGWNTSFIQTDEGETGANSLEIPPYAIVILEDIPVQTPSSVAENFKDHLRVYPNPTDSYVNLELLQNKGYQTDIELTDISGRMLLFRSIQGIDQTRLDLSDLPAGTYIIHVKNEEVDVSVRVSVTG